ncbi:MAG: GNAT family N-acetyltransferase [Nostoc sp. TH1S01]|nr:GNAT family N-acetyltransferase [Nostoc sp. TH1S01]
MVTYISAMPITDVETQKYSSINSAQTLSNELDICKQINTHLQDRFSIKIAKTLEDKTAIYRLRYEIYVEEMQFSYSKNCQLYIDHNNKTLTDSMDDNHEILVYAIDNYQNKVIATVRINFPENSYIHFKNEYSVEEFYPYYPNFVSNTTKAMVHQDYRGRRITLELFKFVYQIYLQKGIVYDFIDCRLNLVDFYKKFGYRIYTNTFIHPYAGECMPMVLCTIDKEHLQKIRSPLFKLLENFSSSLNDKNYILSPFNQISILNAHKN